MPELQSPYLDSLRRKTGEDHLVQRIAKALAFKRRAPLTLGIGDDAALLLPRPGFQAILTSDWFLEGSHFLRDRHPADSIGWKCLARAISDIAAMGGVPKCFLLSLAIPGTHAGLWLDRFLRGLARAARRFDCQVAGGDTTRSDKILVNVAVFGEIPANRAVLRSGAKPGDLIYVTGHLGEAEFGLRILRQSRATGFQHNPLVRKHLYPEPRLAVGAWLATKGIAASMMDLSDGLSSDLPRLCAASRVGARIVTGKLPKVKLPGGKNLKDLDLTELALNGGDDYELLFTARPSQARRLPSKFQGTPLNCIGEITRQQRLVLVEPGGREETLPARGWDPFLHRR
jgi:thiamine-monophosphate kinase